MTDPAIEVRRVWHRIAGAHHDQVIDELIARHREPHRRYHTAVHVMWVCRHVDDLVDHHPVADVDAVLAAALFHDAVYDPRSATNEADSARLAAAQLADIGWTDARCGAVDRLVRATGNHDATADDEAVLLDADLAILGSEVHQYGPYARAVRAEYAHVDDQAWRTGRASVLQQFLHRAVIFQTSTMRTAREARARANLTAELATLQRALEPTPPAGPHLARPAAASPVDQ